MKKNPKVSVLCLAYNHEKFIRQALESIVAQKTNFDFEVLVHDDASTDGTAGIIKEFEKKYSHIIKPILQSENQFSKGIRGITAKFLIPASRGDYIAPCEGDDFFEDEKKLQTQADFLDDHPDCSLCFHPVRVFFENREEAECIFPETKDASKFTIRELLKQNFMSTNAVMYRRQDYGNLSKENFVPADWYLHLYHAKSGKIGFIDEVLSVYRRHPDGFWWDSYKNMDRLLRKNGIHHLNLFFELLKLFEGNPECEKIIKENINKMLRKFARIDKESSEKLIKKAMASFSDRMANIFSEYMEETDGLRRLADQKNQVIAQKNKELESKDEVIRENVAEVERKKKIIRQKDAEIALMRSSKFWKLRKAYLDLKKRLLI